MANAAAKKAAAAKKDAQNTYLPVLVVTNLVYLALLLGGGNLTNNNDDGGGGGKWWNLFGAVVTWAEQIYGYVGILDHAATNAGIKSKDLKGGSSLDLLAVTMVVQSLTIFHTTSWYWVSIVGVPLMGAYNLYNTVYGGDGSKGNKKSNSSKPKESGDDESNKDDPAAARRQRRADKRRQKWK